jgi:hypothetical protein
LPGCPILRVAITGPTGEHHADQRTDLRSATVAVSHDRQVVTVSAQLHQPTSPATEKRFPVRCIGSPERLRFTAYVQLFNDTADGIIGGEYAPAWDAFSAWLNLR